MPSIIQPSSLIIPGEGGVEPSRVMFVLSGGATACRDSAAQVRCGGKRPGKGAFPRARATDNDHFIHCHVYHLIALSADTEGFGGVDGGAVAAVDPPHEVLTAAVGRILNEVEADSIIGRMNSGRR